VCAVIGAAVAPTDAALGAAIVEDERVPTRIRRLLNVESGLNDGIATPFVNFFLVAAVVGTSAQVESESAALLALALGAVLGIVVGGLSGRGLELAARAGWAEAAFVPIATLATALASYAIAVGLGGNGFVAAFVAGVAYRAAHRVELDDEALELTHQMGTVLSLGIWFVFGSIATGWLGGVTWREIAFALLALTVVRMAPVALALVRSGLDRATVRVVGWFGPRGLASVVFALLAGDVLEAGDAQRTFFAIGTTVLLSVVLHGATAAPIAARYGSTHHQTEA
jgi:NhaP-type Na+/H+ or K+/H+ antiporter